MYGEGLAPKEGLSPILAGRIPGVHKGYFDEVVIFWDEGVDISNFVHEVMLPGTVVMLVRPRASKHSFWMTWAGLDLSCERTFDVLEKFYKIRELGEENTANTTTTALGLEAR